MGSEAPWARVIVVNHNAGPLLQACLDALAAQTLRQFEAIIVDNASRDGSIEALRLPDDRFRVIRASANLGFAAANNLGAAGCQAGWIATLNPDAAPRKTWLEELRRATLRHKGVRMFGSTQIDAAHPDRVDGFGDVYSIFGTAWRGASGAAVAALPDDDREVFAPCAAAALYARDAFLAEGGFDESFFCYLEDIDLGFRLRLRGERCVQVRRAEMLHVGSAIAGADSDFFVFHSTRNRLWVMVKNLPSPLIWLVLLLQIAVVPLVLLRRGRQWGPALLGLGAGLLGLPKMWRERRKVQGGRVLSNAAIASLLVWNPCKVLSHAPHYLPPISGT
jgi:N-acetylglucosaminyl-diphospho-decaprenol L-rhamnosyltransferase